MNKTNQINSEEPLVQIIGLEDSYRGDDIEKLLSGNNIKFISKLGVKVKVEDFENEIFHNSKISNQLLRRQLTLGELGCTLAHKNAATRLISSDFNYSIVFEDDAKILHELNIEQIANFLRCDSPRVVMLSWDKKFAVLNSKEISDHRQLRKLVVPPTTTTAYAINRPAAQIISQMPKIFNTVSDWPISTFNKIDFFVLAEPVACPAGFKSEIDAISNRAKLHNSNSILRKMQTLKVLTVSIFNNKYRLNDISFRQIINYLLLRDLVFYLSKPVKQNELYYVLNNKYKFLNNFFKL